MNARNVETTLFALAAIIPLVPYLVVLMHGVPRYTTIADFAIIEQHTRHVFSGETLLGLQSRYPWHHPGPLFFYFVAPFTVAFGRASTGLFVGSWVLVALGFAWLVALTRRATSRACAFAVLFVVVAWLEAFGDVATNPWGRLIDVAPLVVSLGFAALLASGVARAIYPLALFGCMAAETHVSTVTTTLVIALAACVVFVVRAHRRGELRRDAKHVALASVLVLVFVAPMLIEQARAATGEGNISKLYEFFVHAPQPLQTPREALRDWAMATAWLPDRVLERGIRNDTGVPLMMAWDYVPRSLSTTARTFTALHVVTAALGLAVASKRRDRVSLAFLVCGIAGEAIAISSIRSIVGLVQYSLLFWVTAPCAITWMGVFSAFGSWCARVAAGRRALSWSAATMLALALGRTTLDQVAYTTRLDYAPGTMPCIANDLRGFVADIESSLAKNEDLPVIHLGQAWGMAAAVALELEKDGVDVRYGDADSTVFAGGRDAGGVSRARHLWFRTPGSQLPNASCVELIATRGSWEAFGASSDITTCPAFSAHCENCVTRDRTATAGAAELITRVSRTVDAR
jgi:hypothetical protein